MVKNLFFFLSLVLFFQNNIKSADLKESAESESLVQLAIDTPDITDGQITIFLINKKTLQKFKYKISDDSFVTSKIDKKIYDYIGFQVEVTKDEESKSAQYKIATEVLPDVANFIVDFSKYTGSLQIRPLFS